MVVNDFKAFATEENANVLTQEEYENLEALGEGFQSGIARSEQLNKVWRQATTMAAVVAQFMADKAGDDVLDDGNLDKLRATLVKALLNNATSQLDDRYLKADSNLSDVNNATTARGNLGLKGAAVQDVGTIAGTVAAGNDSRIVNSVQRGNNLSDLTDKAAARTNLGLKGAASVDIGTVAGTVAAGNDSRIVNAVQRGNNLSELTDKSIARNNLGLKGAALADIGSVAGTVAAGNDSRIVNAVQRGNNLSDLPDKAAARRTLGLKGAALTDVGTVAGTVAAGNDSRIVNAAQRGNNLSDLTDMATARRNLGLKNAATADVGTTAGTVAAGNDSRIVNAAQRGSNLSDLANKSTALANLNGVARTTTVNGKALTGNISVTSQDIFNTQAVAIPTGRNLNDYQTPGLYYQSANLWAEAGSNYPEALAGALVVLRSAGVTQMYIVYNTSRIYTRSLYNGTNWTSWAKEYNSLNKPTAADVGALALSGGSMAGTITGVYKGPFAFAQQYDSKAPFYEDYSTRGTSEYHPVIKQRARASSNAWVFSQGSLISGTALSWRLYMRGSTGDEVMHEWNTHGHYRCHGQVIPTNYSNFDIRYQTKNTASKAANGWFKDTSTGMIFQWGRLNNKSVGIFDVTFPIAFPSACVCVSNTVDRTGMTAGADNWSTVRSVTRTGFQGGVDRNGSYWMAIGF